MENHFASEYFDTFMLIDPRMRYYWHKINKTSDFRHEDLLAGLKRVKPVQVKYYEGGRVSEILQEDNRRMRRVGRDCFGKLTFDVQEWGKSECFKMVEAYERKRGYRYDYVIRSRPDSEVQVSRAGKGRSDNRGRGYKLIDAIENAGDYGPIAQIHSWSVRKGKNSSAAISDKFAIVPRRHAELFFNVFDRILTRCHSHREIATRCKRHAFDELTCILGTTLIARPEIQAIINQSHLPKYRIRTRLIRPHK